MKTDIEIARSVQMKPVTEVAQQLGINPEDLELYGKFKAKVPLSYIDRSKNKNAKLILVSAISPTPAGEGKTTVSIGLSQALNRIGKRSCVVLREPSLGPVFGLKGGATGGGMSQVLPMEDINLHFTGDFSAIEKAHNLLAALIDNNIQSKTRSLGLDPRTISWKRVMDMNDRSLRHVVAGLGGTGSGVPRETGFDITAASEVMAILCLATSMSDLKRRLGNIFVGFTYDKKPIYARDLNAEGAMATLLKDAIYVGASLAVDVALTMGLKYAVGRERPYDRYPGMLQVPYPEGSPSMPSGHTSLAFATATALTLKYPKWYVAVPCYAWACSVGYSRMNLGVHYPTDVLTGAVLGAGSAYVTHLLNEWFWKEKMKDKKIIWY